MFSLGNPEPGDQLGLIVGQTPLPAVGLCEPGDEQVIAIGMKRIEE